MEVIIKIIPHSERPMRADNGLPVIDAKNFQVGIIQHGTQNGQTVVAFGLETVEGQNIVAEITANQFNGLMSAYRGAEIRFAELRSRN